MTGGRWRGLSSGPLAMLCLTFPGVFLVIDLLHAAPGIMVYATWAQAAQIFLYSAALAVFMSALACLIVVAVPGLKRYAVAVYLTLIAFALLHGLLLWSQYFSYSLEYQWVRQWAVVMAALAAGPALARHLREPHLAALGSVLRASTALIALITVACALLLAALSGETRAAATTQSTGAKPSIFLITIDALSAPYLPMYGHDQPTAPRLAEFAAGATVFLRNYANANLTTPGVNSIMLGTRPWTHRAVHIEARPLAGMSADSLPARLEAAGYFTAAVATNPWAAPRHLGLSDYFAAISEHNVCAASDPLWVLPQELQIAVQHSIAWSGVHSAFAWGSDRIGLCAGRQFDPQLAFAAARRIINAAPRGQPIFLWVHLFPPHDPYITPAPFVGTFAAGPELRDRTSSKPPYGYEAGQHLDFPGVWRLRYQEAIRYIDHHVGVFLDELRESGRYAPSLIIITADHGESFSKFYGAHGGPALHEELVRIPLLIKLPGQSERRETRQLSEQVDLLPTMLELAGLGPLPPRVEGISLVAALRGRETARPVFSMNFQQSTRLGSLDTGTVAMVDGRWKYVHYFGKIYYPYMPVLEDALYDLEADPTEQSNQVVAQAERAGLMRKQIEAQLAQHARPLQ
jgi:arylsulfatase A-like enzyme